MPNLKKKVRPSTASGVIQSSKIPHILDEIRPNTAIGKHKESFSGLEPTFITAQHSFDGLVSKNKYFGKQVHGGIDKRKLNKETGRRATLGPSDNFELLAERDQPKRPLTAAVKSKSLKIEERITLEHLNKMKQAFEEADDDNSGTLDLEEFKNVFRYFLELKGASEYQMTSLFMKIDSSSDGEINWDEFCTYMQLEYAEKEESYFRAKETSFYLPATVENSPHRDTVLRICHTTDNTFMSIGQDGLVSFWTPSLGFKRTKQIENGSKKNKWITDFVLMPQYNKFIIATGDREIQFHELSTFEGYCQISSLETVPLTLDYCFVGNDECLLLFGDSEGCISILIMKSVGELLRLWKKMPHIESIANINIDSVASSENVQFIRWKVHNDWVQDLRYYHSIRSIISCSTDSNNSLVIGQTVGSTHVSSHSKDKKTLQQPINSVKDFSVRRRLPADETVFKIYKGVKTFDFSKIKNIMATGGMDRLIRLWNPYVPSKPTGILRGHVTPIFYLFIVEEDNRLFSISNDKTVKVWDIHDQTCLLTVRPKSHLIKGELSAVHYNPLSRGLAITTDHIALLKLKSKPLSMQMTTTHKEAVTCCSYNSSFNHVVTSSESSVIKVWDMETGAQVFEYSKAHENTPVTCMSFDSTERRLLTSGQDGTVKIWNYNNGHCLNTLQPEDADLQEISNMVYFTINKNRYIVAVGWDRHINIYSDDQDNLHHIKTPFVKWPDDKPGSGHKEDIIGVSYSPPYFLATSSYDGEILIWNVTSGRIFSRLSVKEEFSKEELLCGDIAVDHLLFLPERSKQREAATLISNGPKARIHFWNIFDSKEPYTAFTMPNKSSATGFATTVDNMFFIVSSEDGFVYVWDIEDYCCHGKEEEPPTLHNKWRAHVRSITSIVYIPKQNNILTASIDCTVRCWTFDGHFIGTFGQPKVWDIYDASSYQHPMAPYDVLVDPTSIPAHSVFDGVDSDLSDADNEEVPEGKVISNNIKSDYLVDDSGLKEMMQNISITTASRSGKRLRHAKLKAEAKKASNGLQLWNASSAYKSLNYYELDEVPTLPS